MEVLGARPIYSMSDPEKVSALDAAMAELARLSTFVLQLTAELERTGYAQEIGAGDTARFLSKRYRIDLPKARRTVRLATTLDKHPATTAALPNPAAPFTNPTNTHPANDTDLHNGPAGSDGSGGDAGAGDGGDRDGWQVHPDQAEAILAVLAKVPASVPMEDIDFAEQQLIELAATHTPQQLRDAGKPILAILDPDGPEPSEKRAYTRESLTWKNADQGVKFQGFLACENAELFRTVIHAGAKPRKTIDGEPDPRPWTKRQADALTTALSDTLNATTSTRANNPSPVAADGTGQTGPSSQEPLPGATEEEATSGDTKPANTGTGSTRPADTVASRPGAADPDPDAGAVAGAGTGAGAGALTGEGAAAGLGAGVVAGHGPKAHISVTIDFNDLKSALTQATGTMMFGDTLSAATVRRLACDAEILPIVLGSKSQPLDVGTSQRLVTQPMRRALNARDKGCVACGAPPNRCEAHHLKHWIDGGITAVSNLVLLCKRDHLDLHSGHWTIQIIDDVVHVTRPPWADPGHIPPNKYQPPHLPNQPPTTRNYTDRTTTPDRDDPCYAGRTDRDGRSGTGGRDGRDAGRWLSVVGSPRSDSSGQAGRSDRLSPVNPAASAGSSPAAGPDPWGDDAQTSPPTRVAAPKAPWADEPPPPAAATPPIPWADEPLPTTRPTSAPWSDAGFDPWAEAQEADRESSTGGSTGSSAGGGTSGSTGGSARGNSGDGAPRSGGDGALGSVA